MSNPHPRNVFYLRVDAPCELADDLFRRPSVCDTEVDDDPYGRDQHAVQVGRSSADVRPIADEAESEFPDARVEPIESDERPRAMEGEGHFVHAPDNRRGLAIVAAVLSLALLGSAGALGYKLFSSNGNETLAKPEVRSNVTSSTTQVRENEITQDPDRPHVVRSERATGFSLSSLQPTPALTAPGSALMEDRPMAPVATVDGRLPAADVVPSAPARAPTGSYLVQLSSQRSEAAAQATTRIMQTKYGEFFRDRHPFVRRSDAGKQGVYYRGLVGPFRTVREAKEFCGSLKQAGADCIVQHD